MLCYILGVGQNIWQKNLLGSDLSAILKEVTRIPKKLAIASRKITLKIKKFRIFKDVVYTA